MESQAFPSHESAGWGWFLGDVQLVQVGSTGIGLSTIPGKNAAPQAREGVRWLRAGLRTGLQEAIRRLKQKGIVIWSPGAKM